MPSKPTTHEPKSTKAGSAKAAAAPKASKVATKPATKKATQAARRTGAAGVYDAEDFVRTVLSREDEKLLAEVAHFLFHVHPFAARARLLGYDDNEHEYGQQLYARAAGRNRPLSHWIAESDRSSEPVQYTAEQTQYLQDVDRFENTWFPRIRGIIQRVVAPEQLKQFNDVFFQNLSQQPLGPTVLDSVSTLLDRFEELPRSKLPGAREVHALGVKRGLTAQRIDETRQLIASARSVLPKSARHDTAVSLAELKAAQHEQLEAVGQLRRWYNDWATTFRTAFNPRALIRMGLMELKRPSGAAESEPAATTPESSGEGAGDTTSDS